MKRLMDRKEFLHLRFTDTSGQPLPHGGVTVCYLPSEGKAKIGIAMCSPEQNFNRKIGRLISEGRAKTSELLTDLVKTQGELLEALQEPVTTRWNEMANNRKYTVRASQLTRSPRREKK